MRRRVLSRLLIPTVWLGALLVLPGDSRAQAAPPINGIYTCTDANGRKLRSDRPIEACLDREQKVLNPSGTVRARVAPEPTAEQRAEQEARRKAEVEEQARALDEKRRDRALLARYGSREVHDKERAASLAQFALVVQAANKRIESLREDRKKIDRELEFYQGDPKKAPPQLRRQIDYVEQGLDAQQRFIQHQQTEQQRVIARFDAELARLQELWQDQPPSVGGQRRAAKP